MGGKSRYAGVVLALFAAFVLVCGTWYLARTTAPEPFQVSSVRRPPAEEVSGEPDAEGEVYPDSLLPGEVIDINTADAYDLQRLPGIGEKRAGDIVAYREEHGPFSSVDGLTEVSGIGPGILEGLREYVTAG
ncbi:MAG: ComEA family DNA-binding protein [Lawsonibacter sp.]|nr:ComEA family DNA-binding protein [Lawsonibacter sp.]